MKIVITEGIIKVDGVKKAEFKQGEKKLGETFNGGSEVAGEMLRALKAHKTYGWESADLSDRQIKDAKTIWDLVPEAPRPDRNLGESDPIVSRFVESEYPAIFAARYPKGHYDFDEAGCGENLSEFRENDLKPTKEALVKLRNKKLGKVEQARRYLEMVEERA